jgi:hypothetical protein
MRHDARAGPGPRCLELERLIAERQLLSLQTAALEMQAANMIARALYRVPDDPRRGEHVVEDDCELCRMLATDAFVS